MNAYMAYRVTTKAPPSSSSSSSSLFRLPEFSVRRRFSDFLGLHGKLASKYMHAGYIVPPAPEKSIVGTLPRRHKTRVRAPSRRLTRAHDASVACVGMTKVKVGKEDPSSNEFVEKRRLALERYDEAPSRLPSDAARAMPPQMGSLVSPLCFHALFTDELASPL